MARLCGCGLLHSFSESCEKAKQRRDQWYRDVKKHASDCKGCPSPEQHLQILNHLDQMTAKEKQWEEKAERHRQQCRGCPDPYTHLFRLGEKSPPPRPIRYG